MGEIANCPNCNVLFVKGIKSVCDACYQEEEAMFDKVYTFIRKKENRMATIDEVVEATGVSRDVIMKFVNEKRLHTGNFPNLTYPCYKCGGPIKEGKLCRSCTNEIKSDLQREKEIEEVHKANKESEHRQNTYYSGISSRNRHN
ncbi:TIGR03826 family flagellar region protein [Pontibacillus litoralis]|uniref:Flagellar protein n=1 Tax=Pontibacillus litoralis JSM 072002 TaxID=1385512 RepID=A0A0A5HRQ9_9BACI|nr:TIGR03826 family flagellar region protein [Pontibacillus litoralis]KGX86317.1 hypothetical protein N784_05045 [Pontibacillus litoralis JSM 072002]